MRKITALKSFLVSAAALASALGLAGSASAAGTWTVSGLSGGPITGTSTDAMLTDAVTGTQLTCTTATITLSGTDGTGLSGTDIAQVSGASWSGCLGPLGIAFNLGAQNLPWHLNATGYDDFTGTTGTLTGFEAHLGGLDCTADLRGATSTTPATLTITFNHGGLHVSGTLHAYNVSGFCLGLVNNNDAVAYTADYGFSSPVTITSP